MAQETRVEETRCSLQTFERNRYFYGKPMTVSDFEAEQRYLVGKHRYINRLVHGAGVLCGLQVTLPANFDAENPTVEVAEGAALDCCGNLIVVSRSSTVEVKGDYEPEAVNYLFIKYAECSKHPVMLAANGSSCEEVCCYNRIQETFEIVASTTAPGGAAAAITPAPPAKKAKATGTTYDPVAACRALTEQYYQENLKTCPGCDDPLVFLAVLDPKEGEIDEAETARHRSVVFNNPMLHGLLCDHVTDRNNPHETSAQQVRALQSVNGVGNYGTRSWVGNIDLRTPDNTLTVDPKPGDKLINLLLADNAVRPRHLHDDVINHLLQSNGTVKVVPNVGTKSITLSTTPAASVTSVGRNKVVGASSSFAPGDHAHDLSEGVVDRKHLGEDVYKNLVQGGGAVKVEGDPAAQTIRVSAEVPSPGVDVNLVSSINGAKRVGESRQYAREDHAHDLYINGHSPNASGEFRLIPGANITIEEGSLGNELVISAEGGGRTVIASGVFVFENVQPQQVRFSDLIPHGLESGVVAVVLALEEPKRTRLTFASDFPDVAAKSGDITAFLPDAPFLMAEADYRAKTLLISLKDRRLPQTINEAVNPSGFLPTTSPESDLAPSGRIEPGEVFQPVATFTEAIVVPSPRTYTVRWWAIPA